MKNTIGIAVLFLCLCTALQAADRPNIIVILADDMGYSDMGCFGGEIETPRLDSLAANGLRFTEFYNCARCWPTRVSLLSGRYIEWLTTPKHVTIPQVLKTAGYDTAMAGKWHANDKAEGPAGPNAPFQRGFDDFYGTLAGAGSFFDPHTLTRNTKAISADEGFYYTDRIGEEAVRQIEGFAKTGRPFFQYVSFTAPHWPMHAPEETIQKYLSRYEHGWEQIRDDRYARMLKMGIIDAKRFPLPPLEPEVVAWEDAEHKAWHVRQMAIYAAMVDHMDQAVGRLIETLKRTEQFENTLIIYFHDNGACSKIPNPGAASFIIAKAKERGETVAVGNDFGAKMGGPLTFSAVGPSWANAQNTPMRRYKNNTHNGGALTPAIMHWPAGLKAEAGSISTQRGHAIDMMATCLELAEVEYPTEFNGTAIDPHQSLSLVPILQGKTVTRDQAYFFRRNATTAVVKGDYKIVKDGKADWELYNLSENRTETEDIAAQYPDLVREMSKLSATHWRKK